MDNVTIGKKAIDRGIIYLIIIGLATAVLWQFQIGRFILYPFTILGTWFHEMGHGLSAIILGGNFIRLDIFSDASGIAVHSDNSYLGALGRALIAAGGPIGPTIAGSLFVVGSSKKNLTRLILFLLSLVLIISDILWVRTTFGFIIILIFALLIGFIALKTGDKVQRISLQFLGIQAFLSLYLSVSYLFSGGGVINGVTFKSDTQHIADSLLLPYWFWATCILAFSIFLIFFSFRKVIRSGTKQVL